MAGSARHWLSRVAVAIVVLAAARGPVRPAAQQIVVLDAVDVKAKPAHRHALADGLREISGLAVSADGRLFAHDDETAEIHAIDPSTGRRLLRFGLGRTPLAGDFEGLAIAETRFFLITSAGTLLEFPEGRDRERVEYRRHTTGLGRVCEVEGLAYDGRTRALLAVCKAMHAGGPPGIYAFDLDSMRLELRPKLVVRRANGEPIHPSGLAVHEPTGHLIVVAARERIVLELDRTGRPLAERRLDRRTHPQAEGVEFLPDGSLVIADEAAGGRARIAVYRRAGKRP